MCKELRRFCIGCGKDLGKIDTTVDYAEGSETSSLCNPCLLLTITLSVRKKQLKEGNFDCYGKSQGYCDQSGCKYREKCLSPERPSTKMMDMFIQQFTSLSEKYTAGEKPLANFL